MKKRMLLVVLTLLCVVLMADVALANVSGAIFTTVKDGTVVNGNTKYTAKEDVYLDGGPGPNAPVSAAGLRPNNCDYYFMVTDPSGAKLLSMDPIESRRVHVNEYGVIDKVYSAPTITKYLGKDYGTHLQGIDQDHGAAPWNAITVQLMPFDDTPNRGGVYKVWMTPVLQYRPGEGKFGFIPSESKTDNYKVKGKIVPPVIKVKKFHDLNANGVWDSGEPELKWWVDVEEPCGAPGGEWTPFDYMAGDSGDYKFTESSPTACPPWKQTALIIDGVPQPVSATALVKVLGASNETHEVIFGNVQTICVKAEKYYDKDGDGERDLCEVPVPGIKFNLYRVNADGTKTLLDTQCAGSDGTYNWCGLLAGKYAVEEILPGPMWIPSTPTYVEKVICAGETKCFVFGNYCTCKVGFFTKGYWHNKNGMSVLNTDDRDFVNGLSPYKTPSSYFGAGDELFDGKFSDGTPVAAAFNNDDNSLIWGAGTWQAEVSQFLVDSNQGGDPREQLAQQLLAFIFNVRHYAPGATIIDGTSKYDCEKLIAGAIKAWESGTDSERNSMAGLLDYLNNHHIDEGCGLTIICGEPCPVVY